MISTALVSRVDSEAEEINALQIKPLLLSFSVISEQKNSTDCPLT